MSAGKVEWTPEKDAMLGKVTDGFLAMQWGVTNACIAHRRKKLGVLPFHAEKSRTLNPWTPEQLALLGTLPDSEVAKMTGRPLGAVMQRRHALEIPAFKRLAPKFEFLSWDKSLALTASGFFAVMAARHLHCFNRPLTYAELANMSQYAQSEIEGWFAPGGDQEILSVSARHHLWLLASSW